MGGLSGFFKKAAPYLAGAAAGGISNQFSATRPFSAALSAGAGALTNKKNPLAGALQGGVGGTAGSAVGGGINSMFKNNGFGSGATTGFNNYVGSIPGFGGFGTSNPTGVMSKFLSPATAAKGLTNDNLSVTGNRASFATAPSTPAFKTPVFSTGAATGAPASTMTASLPGSQGIQPMKLFGGGMGQIGAGLGVSALGNFMAPKVQTPDWSGITNDLRTAATEGANPEARALGLGQLKTTIGTTEAANAEPALANAKLVSDRQRAEALRSNEQQWHAAQPGADITQNSDYQRSVENINRDYDQNYSAQVATTQSQYDQQLQQNKLAAAQAALGLDESQMSYLTNIAQMDINQIMLQTGISYGEAAQVKQLFGDLGTGIATGAFQTAGVTK